MNATDNDGNTALIFAVWNGNLGATEALMLAGPLPNTPALRLGMANKWVRGYLCSSVTLQCVDHVSAVCGAHLCSAACAWSDLI